LFSTSKTQLNCINSWFTDRNLNNIEKIFDKVFTKRVKKLVFTGVGKSGKLGKLYASLFTSAGLVSVFVDSNEALHGDLGYVSEDDVVIAISNSGKTSETIKMVKLCQQRNPIIISVCKTKETPLGLLSDHVIELGQDLQEADQPLQTFPTTSVTLTSMILNCLLSCYTTQVGLTPEQHKRNHPGGNLGNILNKCVDDVMSELLPVQEGSSFIDIISNINHNSLGIVPVLNGRMELTGCITDGDVRRYLDNDVNSFNETKAVDFMTKVPYTIKPGTLCTEAKNTMNNLKITVLLIQKSNKVYGVSIHDI
jgi:arabinose-5-phosphate isomerase